MLRKPVALIALALVVALAGCATSSAYQSAVVAATETDRQFVHVGHMYDTLYRAGKISVDDYAGWSVFAAQYKVLSSQLHVVLKTGVGTQSAEEAIPLIQNLATQLALYYAYGIEKSPEVGPDEGGQ